MNHITVPYNKTSDERIVSQVLRQKYVESFQEAITELIGAFEARVQEKIWLRVTDKLWLCTPFNIFIYDPMILPQDKYEKVGQRYLKKTELEKVFCAALETNPFYDKEKCRIRYRDRCNNVQEGYCIRSGKESYFSILDGSDDTTYERYFLSEYYYLSIRVDDTPKEHTLISYCLERGYNPFDSKAKHKRFFDIVSELFNSRKILWSSDTFLLKNDFVNELMEGTYSQEELGESVFGFVEKLINGLSTECCSNLLKKEAIQSAMDEAVVLSDAMKKKMLQELLECDFRRNAMDPYDETRLKNPNGGHWELWKVQKEEDKQKNEKGDATEKKASELGKVCISIDTGWMARNPVADVKANGVVGIDFGTKSTVVTFRDGSAKIRPLRVGKGKYSERITKEDYENPTVIEFKDMKSFLDAYHKKSGRPNTLWEDVTVSHFAAEQMKAPTSQEVISSYFSDIKQWTSDPDRQVRIRDQKNHERVLGQYRSLKENESFDPLEIYAYYLGLFINNMRQGIYLRYKLSYPAKAEIDLRERLRKSFEKGLKKSLPQAVLDDAGCMQKFKVELGMSEPAAYAVSALRGYGFGNINDDDKVFYGIFDFGGGTTDFDFGVWETEIESRSYDYRITHFGENGDPYLGGENLIEYMAFEVFKDNKDALLKEHIVFAKPHNCEPFIGSEMLISDSREALVNLRKLAEQLRGFWHGVPEVVEEIKKNKMLTIQLFSREGNLKAKVELNVDAEKLSRILDEQIDDGVKQFFIAMRGAFSESNSEIIGQPDKVHIFLAGNSSKSPRVMKLFKKHIDEYEKGVVEEGQGRADEKYILMYPPLGVPASDAVISGKIKPFVDEIIEFESDKSKETFLPGIKQGENAEEGKTAKAESKVTDNVEEELGKPSGKTGVAFGLLDSKVHVIQQLSEEGMIAFKFYLGYEKRKQFKSVISPETPYNEWIEFVDVVDSDTVELYYTELAEARTNVMDIEANSIRCIYLNVDLSEVQEDSYVFIRTIDAAKIEYVVATREEIQNKGAFDDKRVKQIEIKNH